MHLRTTVPCSSLTGWPPMSLTITCFLHWLAYDSFCHESPSWRGWKMRLYLPVILCQRLFLVKVWFWISQRSPYLFSLKLLHLFSALFPPRLPCFFCFILFTFVFYYLVFKFFLLFKNVFKQINFLWYLCWKFIQLDPSRKRESRLRNCFYEQSAYWYLGDVFLIGGAGHCEWCHTWACVLG